MRGSARDARGVLLVGPMSDGPLVGGIENGIDMILRLPGGGALAEACCPARRN